MVKVNGFRSETKMKIKSLLPILMVLSFRIVPASAAQSSWAVDFADAIMARWPNSINDMTNKGWEYSNAIVLQGIERTYANTDNASSLNYIRKYVDQYVDATGNVAFDSTAQSLDKLHPAILCLFLFNKTGQQKYKTAATKLFSLLKRQPTNASGGFWHKKTNANQMLLDGIYMAEPFLAKYGFQIGEQNYCDSMAAFQILLLSSHVYVSSKKLLLHGWDETKTAAWADPATGVSSEVWSRAMGWFSMALVEVLKYFPKDHPRYNELLALLTNIAEGMKNAQDASTGLWYQVVDKGNQTDNWLETSGSGMMVYALKTAVDCGFIDKSYRSTAQKGWDGVKSKISLDNQNQPVINQYVGSMNVLVDYAAYVSQAKVNCPPSTHPHGYCGVLMAASAMELAKKKYRLTVTTQGQGSVGNPSGELFHDSGSTVTLTAVPENGFHLNAWKGDTTGSSSAITLTMNREKTITAEFTPGAATAPSVVGHSRTSPMIHRVNNRMALEFSLPVAEAVSIVLYNTNGRRIGSVAGRSFSAGSHSLRLPVQSLANGRYIVRTDIGSVPYVSAVVLAE
jgi:unsaturated rhamnogalacturonyl hydrolase